MKSDDLEGEFPQAISDVWPLPKRSSLVQIIGLVEILEMEGFKGKVWNHSKQEALATSMRKRGITRGRNLSGQSVRTLFANGPKYLGFAYTESDSTGTNLVRNPKVYVTQAGKKLVEENLLGGGKYQNLSEWESDHVLSQSDSMLTQLMKLVLNNPITSGEGDFRVFPFRSTLKLCLDLNYLDREELAYIVFTLAREDQYHLVLQRILNFRGLSAVNRKKEIDAYKETSAGQLTLVKAPTVGYFINFCLATGLFLTEKIDVYADGYVDALKVSNKQAAMQTLELFGSVHPYNFQRNKALWIEYFGDPDKLEPPHDVTFHLKLPADTEFYVRVLRNARSQLFSPANGPDFRISVPCFSGDQVKVELFDLTGNSQGNAVRIIENQSDLYLDDLNLGERSEATVRDKIAKHIRQLEEISLAGWDDEFLNKLRLVKDIAGHDAKNNRSKGGRLEQVVNNLLEAVFDEGTIDYLKWFGRVEDFGLPGPAPGGKNGNPDIVFEIDDISVVIELTTIKGTAAQWASSEAASVPDHIVGYSQTTPDSRTVGLFVAPSINSRVKSLFSAQSTIENVKIRCITVNELGNALKMNRAELKSWLESLIDNSAPESTSPNARDLVDD